jgi:hypothetical protein
MFMPTEIITLRRLAKSAKTAEQRKVLQEMEAIWMKLAKEVEGKSAA